MKAQETEDAELLALAALVYHESAVLAAGVGVPFDPYTPAVQELRDRLVARGVLPREADDAAQGKVARDGRV
jgi:hypothetical protein